MSRRFTRSDRLVDQFDTMLRTLVPGATRASRAQPGMGVRNQPMTTDETRHSIEVLRHHHRGRVIGQGVYQGQRFATGISSRYQPVDELSVRGVDHLDWCDTRLRELGGRPSRLTPFYYTASLGAGMLLSRRSHGRGLGLVNMGESLQAESLERQLAALPAGDEKSRAVIRQMLDDSTRHARGALEAGGQRWPAGQRWITSLGARVCEWRRLRRHSSTTMID
ncbi:3-demethoxyubiquinol 3-hydroxylase [Kushneria indalinina]|uniref:Ubiquinone biosynthesis monooxygenase Coq7 n=1 Tax=Kushneria indalinina DSM 14324 TaxID=1122140 RepID=A0A3D9DYG0_9GAMM|nr:demethoxyubiquinone hydroxylase family protein [Kushneria indalinina]REC95705.1 ubiquinone biosynthesis monooxygenase Coq7 [Kushneria indalinina DSM 14324]